MKAAVAEAAGRLELRAAAPVLLAQLTGDPSPAVRLASLNALQTLDLGNAAGLMEIAIKDKDPNVRRAALGILPSLKMPAGQKVAHLVAIGRDGTTIERQGAIEILGSLKVPESRGQLAMYFDELAAGTLPPELHVDLVEAIEADGSPELAERVAAYQASRKADLPALAFQQGLLTGGNGRRGYQVAFEHAGAQCTRCHAFWGRGTEVGPELTRIGSQLTREQILEALVAPNARIAPGYGVVGLTLRSGERVDGTLRGETEMHLTMLIGDPAVERTIAKADIVERTDPVSAMPPLGLVLKLRELRDLVAFLSMLK